MLTARTLISKGYYYESCILIGLAAHCLIVIDQYYSERSRFSNSNSNSRQENLRLVTKLYLVKTYSYTIVNAAI